MFLKQGKSSREKWFDVFDISRMYFQYQNIVLGKGCDFQLKKIKTVLRYDTFNINCIYHDIANNLGVTKSISYHLLMKIHEDDLQVRKLTRIYDMLTINKYEFTCS